MKSDLSRCGKDHRAFGPFTPQSPSIYRPQYRLLRGAHGFPYVVLGLPFPRLFEVEFHLSKMAQNDLQVWQIVLGHNDGEGERLTSAASRKKRSHRLYFFFR